MSAFERADGKPDQISELNQVHRAVDGGLAAVEKPAERFASGLFLLPATWRSCNSEREAGSIDERGGKSRAIKKPTRLTGSA